MGSSENGRDPKLRKPSAPETGKLLKDRREHCFMNGSFQKHSKNNGTLQVLFSSDWHNKSTLHCNGFISLGRTKAFELSFLQHSVPILLAFFSAKSANLTVFRIPILLVTEIFLCEAYSFRQTSQTSDAQKNTPLDYVSKGFSLYLTEDITAVLGFNSNLHKM